MKTIKEWLETLPEPYKSQALANVDENFSDYIENKDRCSSVNDALEFGFDWEESKEGFDYWSLAHKMTFSSPLSEAIELLKEAYKELGCLNRQNTTIGLQINSFIKKNT